MSCPAFASAHRPARPFFVCTLLALSITAICSAQAQTTGPDDIDKATELDAINVTGERVHANSGALGNRSVRDTPFAIQVIDREDLAKRQVVSLGDAFFNDPSVVTQVASYASGWSSPIINRGVGLNYDSYRVNGLQVSSWGSEWPLEVMEQVELLKGPGGFLYGFGAPGGIVNYTTKKPTDEQTFSARAGWRSASVASGQVDVGGRFGNEDMFGYRFNLFREKGETYNGGDVDRKVMSAAVDARLSDTLTWSADMVYQKRELSDEAPQYYFDGITSMPRPIAGDADRSVEGSYYDTRSRLLSTALEWRFAPNWSATLSYGFTSSWNDVNKIFAYITDVNGDYDINAYELGGASEWKLVQALLQGTFDTGPLHHQLVAGASRQDGLGWDRPYDWKGIGTGNLYDWQGLSYPARASRVMTRGSETIQKAVFVSDTVEFAPGWSVLAGWRYNDFEQVGSYHTYPVTPTYALMYKPADAVTLYASYIESLEAGSRVGDDYLNAGQLLDPTISRQYEIGAKIEYPRWNANAAAFRMERGATIDRITDTGRYLEQDGITLYEGVELSGNLQLTDNFSLGGGGTWLDPSYDKLSPDSAADEGNRVSFAARWQGVVHADYTIPGVEGLSVYGAVRYFGDVYYDTANTLKLPDYTLASLGAGYRMQLNGHGVTWRASIDNLTDRKYWLTNSLGTPRTYAVSVQFDL